MSICQKLETSQRWPSSPFLNWENTSIRSGCRQTCREFSWLMMAIGGSSPSWAEPPWTDGPAFYKKAGRASLNAALHHGLCVSSCGLQAPALFLDWLAFMRGCKCVRYNTLVPLQVAFGPGVYHIKTRPIVTMLIGSVPSERSQSCLWTLACKCLCPRHSVSIRNICKISRANLYLFVMLLSASNRSACYSYRLVWFLDLI